MVRTLINWIEKAFKFSETEIRFYTTAVASRRRKEAALPWDASINIFLPNI